MTKKTESQKLAEKNAKFNRIRKTVKGVGSPFRINEIVDSKISSSSLKTSEERKEFARKHIGEGRYNVPVDEILMDLEERSDLFDHVWDDSPIEKKEFAKMIDETIELML